MANEISLTTNLTSTNGTVKVNKQIGAVQIDQVAQGRVQDLQAIGTTAEAINLGSISTPGVSVMQNSDATDTIYVGLIISSAGSFETFIELKPGEAWGGRLGLAAPYAKSSANNPKLDYTIMEA